MATLVMFRLIATNQAQLGIGYASGVVSICLLDLPALPTRMASSEGKRSRSKPGGMMKSQLSGAEDTAAVLLDKRRDSPVMIPGAFERRISASVGTRADSAGTPATDRALAVSVRERFVYEPEGGGAPSERPLGRPASILQKISRRIRHRPEVSDHSRPFVSLPKQQECATAHAKS